MNAAACALVPSPTSTCSLLLVLILGSGLALECLHQGAVKGCVASLELLVVSLGSRQAVLLLALNQLALCGVFRMSTLAGCLLLQSTGVQPCHGHLVHQRVLLQARFLGCIQLRLEHRLDLIAVDDACHISVLHHGPGQGVSLLGAAPLHGAVDLVKLLEGALSPDDESAKVATGSNLEKVQGVHRGRLNTRDIAKGTHDAVVLAVDNQRTTAHGVPTVAHLAFA